MRTDGNTYLIIGPTGKVYAGQTVDLDTRWSVHKHLGTHKNNKDGYNYLHRAMRKHGAENFTFVPLNSGMTKEQMNNQEKVLIILFQSNNSNYGYNLTSGGDGVWNIHYTPEMLAAMSERQRQWHKNMSPEQRAEHSQKISIAQTKRFSDKTKLIGAAAKNSLKTHCSRGHELTLENIIKRKKFTERTCKICARNRERNKRLQRTA